MAFSGIDRKVLTGLQRQFTTDDAVLQALQDRMGLETPPDIQIEIRSVTTKPVRCSQSRKIVPTYPGWDGADDLDLVILVTGPDPLDYLPMGVRGLLMFADRAGATLAAIGAGGTVLTHLHYLNEDDFSLDAMLSPVIAPRRIVVPDDGIPDLAMLFATGTPPETVAAPEPVTTVTPEPDTAPPTDPEISPPETLSHQKAHQDALIETVPDPDPQEVGPEQDIEEPDTMPLINTDELVPPRPHAGLATDPVLSKMRAVMADSIDAPIALTEIADKMGLSPKQLRLRCKKVLGTTPAQAYLALRLDHARELVNATALPVGDIATCTGFASASAFTRSYKRAFGHSPREARSL